MSVSLSLSRLISILFGFEEHRIKCYHILAWRSKREEKVNSCPRPRERMKMGEAPCGSPCKDPQSGTDQMSATYHSTTEAGGRPRPAAKEAAPMEILHSTREASEANSGVRVLLPYDRRQEEKNGGTCKPHVYM